MRGEDPRKDEGMKERRERETYKREKGDGREG